MTFQRQFGLAATILLVSCLLGPFVAQAQRMAPAVNPRTPAQAVHARPAPPHLVTTQRANNRNSSAVAAGMNLDTSASAFLPANGSLVSLQDLLNPVPGLGFDYAHLAAINRDLGIKAVIDPATQWRLAVAERLLRETSPSPAFAPFLLDGGGAYVIPAEPAATEQPSQQPQIIILQQAPAPQQTATQPAPESAREALAPLPDVGQFTLVLQNGAQIQAVAFTYMKKLIVYITADGSRRTIAAADLDSDATVRVNQERGMQLQLPL